jgi:polyvinyl alcohol dehydrogenase (cytochrome)
MSQMNRVNEKLCVLCDLCGEFLIAAAIMFYASTASAQVLTGMSLYEQHCGSCHNSKEPGNRAPDRVALSQRTPEAILEAITTGPMAVNASALTPLQKRTLAEHLSLRPLGSIAAGGVEAMSNRCAAKPLGDVTKSPTWSGWGVDASNGRFQNAAAAGITPENVGKLKLKWAFGFPNGVSAFSQPAVAGGRVFVGSDNGFVYAIDAATGCAYWSFQAQAGDPHRAQHRRDR